MHTEWLKGIGRPRVTESLNYYEWLETIECLKLIGNTEKYWMFETYWKHGEILKDWAFPVV